MVRYLIDVLSFFYCYTGVDIISEDSISLHFSYKGKNYILKMLDRINDEIYYTQQFSFFHKIIKNKFYESFSFYDNKRYVLLLVSIVNNRKIDLYDFIILSNMKLKHFIDYNKQYSFIWLHKNNYFEHFYKYKDYIVDYISGLSQNAIEYSKLVNYRNVTFGFSYDRFLKEIYLINFWDPTLVKIGPVVNGIAEYIKTLFFEYNSFIDFELLLEFNFTYDDYILLISRLLFPTYLYDSYNSNNCELLVSKSIEYLKYVFKIILEIKNRYNNVPIVEWLKS